MEKDEMELAIKRLQAMNAVHEALLLAIFDQSKDKAAIRQAVVNESRGLGDEMLFHDFSDDELEAGEEATELMLRMLDSRLAKAGRRTKAARKPGR